jgi:hypothetical protein
MNGRSVAGIVLLVAGVALAALGGAGMATGSRAAPTAARAPIAAGSASASDTPVPSPTQSATRTLSPTPTPSPSPASSPSPSPTAEVADDDAIRAFIAELVAAVRAGDVETMGDRLNEATVERYGAAACQTKLAADQGDPTYAIDVIEIHPPAPWDYTTDDRTTRIETAWTVDARVTVQGQDALREVHLAPMDGGVSWFSDCGDPMS